ncbi:LexA family protein [Heliobacterium mobile]|uniref:LexA family protein n=1 Tax=Heliobacterium mobile TaxID=28064 RepID=UPI002E263A2F
MEKTARICRAVFYSNEEKVRQRFIQELKRFIKMGHAILLMPENEKYEPIQINSDQARILGVACAVVKRSIKLKQF